jgi:hypothetical protein
MQLLTAAFMLTAAPVRTLFRIWFRTLLAILPADDILSSAEIFCGGGGAANAATALRNTANKTAGSKNADNLTRKLWR